MFDVFDFFDDYYLNLFDWSVNNVFVVVFVNIVYFWDVIISFIVEFLIVEEDGLVISV